MYELEQLTEVDLGESNNHVSDVCEPSDDGYCHPEHDCTPGDNDTCNPEWPCNPDVCNPGP